MSEQEAYEFWDDEARRLLGLSGVAFMACLVAAGFAAFPPGARG